MKIISWNVNGLRSVFQKDFIPLIKSIDPDILCLQEIKLQDGQVPEEILTLPDYHAYYHYAQKKGYSGTAIFTKQVPDLLSTELGHGRFDSEGRMLKAVFKNFTLLNFYIPNGGRTKENLPYKLDCYKDIFTYLKMNSGKPLVLCGDFNVAHTELDLARPKENKNNIMFTPAERQQIDTLLELGFVDTFRAYHPEGGQYSWWPYFYNARTRNLGWRIDYIFVSASLKSFIADAFILRSVTGSDHCPVGIDFMFR